MTSEIRCSCGSILFDIASICENCIKPMRATLQEEYRHKVYHLNDELLGERERAEIAERENKSLRHQQEIFLHALRYIADEPLHDQPASSGLSEIDWHVLQYRNMKKVALSAISAAENTTSTSGLLYEAKRLPSETIRVRGVGRDLFEPRSAHVMLTERPTNEELISLHEFLRGWVA